MADTFNCFIGRKMFSTHIGYYKTRLAASTECGEYYPAAVPMSLVDEIVWED
jgi:hypothetical protein